MADDSQVTDKGWDNLSPYAAKSSEADDAVTVSISTTPGEWLVNTVDSVVVPMSMAELVELLRAGKLTERSLVWRIGMQEWAHVEKVPQLRLAARLPPRAPSSSPAASRAKPPPKPARPTPVPQAAGLSRRSTLPFGMPAPKVPLPRPAILPTPAADEPALAVYARPAATISFELSADSVRGPAPAAPGTLAPTTSDAVPAAASPSTPRSDLSVVAAAHFRATQRSAKRLVVTCSVASAAAASLLTFWLARGAAPAHTPSFPPAVEPVAAAAPPAPAAPEQPATPTPTPTPTSPEQSSESGAALEAPSAAPAPSAPKAKPRKARVVRAQPIARPPESEPDPSSQPNPYAAKLEQDGQSEGQKPAPVPASAASDKTAAESPAEADSSQQVLDLTQ